MSTTRNPANVSVSEVGARYSGSSVGPVIDAGVQTGDLGFPPDFVGAGNSLHGGVPFHPVDGHHGSSDLLPDLRNKLRATDDVERHRPRPGSGGGWSVPAAVGLGAFLLILGASPVVVWLALNAGEPPVATPPPPQQDELMGIPVRRGLK